MLNQLWNKRTITEVASSFKIDRGTVEYVWTSTAPYLSQLIQFSDQVGGSPELKVLLQMKTNQLVLRSNPDDLVEALAINKVISNND